MIVAALKALAWVKTIYSFASGQKTESKTMPVVSLTLIAAAAFGIWLNFFHDRKVVRNTTQKIERKADVVVKKSVEAQRRVPVDGAAVRVQQRYCINC